MCLDLAHQAQPPLLRAAATNIGHSFLLCTAIVKKEQRMPKVIHCYMCPKYVAKDLFLRTRVATTRSWSIFLLLSSTLPKIKSSVFHRPRASQIGSPNTYDLNNNSSWINPKLLGWEREEWHKLFSDLFFMQNLKEVASWPTTSNLSCAVSNLMCEEDHLALRLIH